MSDHLNHGAALPPRGQQRWHKVASPAKGQPLRAVILGETFMGQWTHYVPPTLPCMMTADCHWCRSGLPPRYNGYIAALIGRPAQLRVLAITYGAACQFTEILQQRHTLRGLDVLLFRKFVSPRAPIVVQVEREIPSEQLPEAFDVVDSLAKMFGVNGDFLKRGCRRIGEDENADKFLREEAIRRNQLRYANIPTGEAI